MQTSGTCECMWRVSFAGKTDSISQRYLVIGERDLEGTADHQVRRTEGKMQDDWFVRNISEWLALEELSIPEIANDAMRGSIYDVLKAGFLMATSDECRKFGLVATVNASGKCTLPTVVVRLPDEKTVLYRLPLGLAEWAETCVAMSHMVGHNPFPAKVEFGILKSRPYAEIM